jgi:hypothetical protein
LLSINGTWGCSWRSKRMPSISSRSDRVCSSYSVFLDSRRRVAPCRTRRNRARSQVMTTRRPPTWRRALAPPITPQALRESESVGHARLVLCGGAMASGSEVAWNHAYPNGSSPPVRTTSPPWSRRLRSGDRPAAREGRGSC